MATPRDIEGLSRHEWRISDPEGVSVAQVKEKETVVSDYHSLSAAELVEKVQRFTSTHYDAQASVEHDFDDHPYGSGCEYRLELVGWRTVTDAELKRAQDSRRAQLRTQELEVERRLEMQRQQAERELAAIREARGE